MPATVVVPRLEGEPREEVWRALRSLECAAPPSIVEEDGEPALRLLADRGVAVDSMGRTPADDRVFFLSAGAAGVVAGRMASQGDR